MVLLVSCLDLQDLAFFLSMALGEVSLPQAFTRNFLIEDSFALVHHEEAFVPMHDHIGVG